MMMLHRIDNPLEQCELKFVSDDDTGEFIGYGSIFNSTDKSGDTIRKGTFVDAINKQMPKMFVNHRHFDIPPGDWLTAKEDDIGLLLEGKIDLNHRDGPSLVSAMKRKAMEGLSTGAIRSTMQFERKSEGGRNITKADLKEVSIVTFPMEESATILSVKSEIESIETIRDCEMFLRDVGLSRSMAKALIGQLRPLYQREVDAECEQKEAQSAALDWLRNVTERKLL
jgi:HK97 family phage prohead protease